MTLAPIVWHGVRVPWTAMWSSEQKWRAPRTVRQRWNGRTLTMLSEGVDTPGVGKPLFKMLHADRCRHVIVDSLCQMCVQPLESLVVCVNQGQTDRFRPLINDGLPMHPDCAREAFAACPGMQRHAAAGVLRAWEAPKGGWIEAPVLLGTAPESAGGDARVNHLIRTSMVDIFTGPKLVLTSCAPFSLEARP